MSNDKFYKDIADKLSDYEMPVSDSVWDAIASSIDSASEKKHKSRVIYFFPLIGAAIAASVVTFVILGGRKTDFNVDPSSPVSIVANNSGEQEPIQVVESSSNVESTLLSDNIAPKRRTSYLPVNIIDEDKTEETLDYAETFVSDSQSQENQSAYQEVIVSASDEISGQGDDETEDDIVPSNNIQDVIDYWASVEAEERYNERSSYKPHLSAGLYSSSSSAATKIGFFDSGDYYVYDSIQADPNTNTNTTIYSSDRFNEYTPREVYHGKTHNQPIRLGVAVGYGISPKLSLESGLVWSSLHSVFQQSWTNQEYTQNLQYIGVPLNLVWTFYQGERFGFYVSGGAMLEKCISGKFGTTRITQHPWQWSLMDAVGAQYSFSKNIGLFVEPGMAYYFEDGSSIESVYKENPTVVSLKLGLRISLL